MAKYYYFYIPMEINSHLFWIKGLEFQLTSMGYCFSVEEVHEKLISIAFENIVDKVEEKVKLQKFGLQECFL